MRCVLNQEENKTKMTSNSERTDEFLSSFHLSRSSIEGKLNLFESTTEASSARIGILDECSAQLSSMKNLYQDNSPLLPPYIQKTSLESIKTIEDRIMKCRQDVKGTKKFSFSQRKAGINNAKSSLVIVSDVSTVASDSNEQSQGGCPDDCKIRTDETIILSADETDGKQISVSHASRCDFRIEGVPKTLQIRHLDACTVTSSPVIFSVALHQVKNSTLRLIGQQIRLTDCHDCSLEVHVTTSIAMEGCTGLTISPLNKSLYESTEISEYFSTSGLDASVNNWQSVDDFDWQFASSMVMSEGGAKQPTPSPNYKLIDKRQST